MSEKSKKATTIFTIKKASLNGKEKEFTDKILNNDIGKEYIIIIAPQNYNHSFAGYLKAGLDAGPNGKFMFVHQALRRVRLNQEFCFSWTILMYTDGYTSKQRNETKAAFLKLATECNFVEIESYQEVVNYINSKDKKQANDNKKLREKMLIERMFIYCHGFVGKLAMGLSNVKQNNDTLDWDENVVAKLKQRSFSKTAKIYSFSCRTGLGNTELGEDRNIYKSVYKGTEHSGHSSSVGIPVYHKVYANVIVGQKPLLGEKSLAQKFANTTSAITYAYCSRSDYEDTLNTPDELDFMDYFEAGEKGKKPKRNNKSYEYLLNKKKWKESDVKRHKELIAIKNKRDNFDGGIFDWNGARYPVKGGNTPVGVPNDMKTYTKQK